MKKQFLTLAFALFGAISFAQQTVSSTEINTKNLEPIVYSSQEELNKFAIPRIEIIKAELNKPNLSEQGIINLKELLWRFEHAIVKSEK